MASFESNNHNREKPLLMVFPLDMAAHYLRCLELCKKLAAYFEILFAYSPKYARFVSNCGFETFGVDNFNSEEVTRAASSFDFSWLSFQNIEPILNSQVKAIRDYEPDLVMGDAAFTLKMAAEKANVSCVSVLNGYMTKYCCITRPVSPRHPGYPYSKIMPKGVFNRISRTIERAMFEKVHAPFRRLRKKLNLAKLSFLLEELEGDYNLICDLPTFFPQKRLPKNYEFVGPLFYAGNEEEREILDFLGNEHPNILVSMGSTGNWKDLNQLCDPVFNDTHVVISGNQSNMIRGNNILSKAFVNHTQMMDKIDIVICHGGNGTTYQALSYGIPLLFFSGNFEQEWNIQRITEMGLGARLEDDFDASRIRETIDTWISKRNKAHFLEVQKTIKSFVDKPIGMTKYWKKKAA